MNTVYFICMAAGILLPLCTMILNVVDGFMDFVSFDLLDISIGDFELSLLPLSLNSLCLSFLLFGLTGFLLDGKLPAAAVCTIGITTGYLAAVLLQSLIHKVRKYETTAISETELLLHDGEVANTIPANGFGAVKVNISNESSPVYPAKSATGESIRQNTIVEILSMTDGVLSVRPSDWLERKYDKPAPEASQISP